MSGKIRAEKRGTPVPPLRALKVLCKKQPEIGEEIYAWTQDGVSSQDHIIHCIAQRWKIRLSGRPKLTQWLAWWHVERRFGRASERALQMEELLARVDPSVSAQRLREFGQMVFQSEAIEQQDVKAFVQLGKLDLQRRALEHEKEKWKESVRTKLQAGLEALFREIQGNGKALAAYEALRTAIAPDK